MNFGQSIAYCFSNYFNFNGGEMASFYISDDSWKQGEEIMLENFTGDNYQMVMKTTKLNSVINEMEELELVEY